MDLKMVSKRLKQKLVNLQFQYEPVLKAIFFKKCVTVLVGELCHPNQKNPKNPLPIQIFCIKFTFIIFFVKLLPLQYSNWLSGSHILLFHKHST